MVILYVRFFELFLQCFNCFEFTKERNGIETHKFFAFTY